MNAYRLARWRYLLAGLFASAAQMTCALNPQPEPPGATASNGPQYAGTGGAAGSAVIPPLKAAGTAAVSDASAGAGGSTGSGGAAGQGGTAGQGGAPGSDASVPADAPADVAAPDAPADAAAPDAPAGDAAADAVPAEASDEGG
jgi:hypothetical protein